MKGSRILGVILFLIVMIIAVNYSQNVDDSTKKYIEVIGAHAKLSDSTIQYDDVLLDDSKTNNVEKIEFTNVNNYKVTINSNDIRMTCKGTGDSKENDEYLVQKNLRITALFSVDENGKKYPSLDIEKGDKVYIHVITNYVGDEYPANLVDCNYNVDIEAA